MDNTRKETKYNKLIGRIGTDYYFLDYTFEHSDNFKGATGGVITPLTEAEFDQRVKDYFDENNMRELWQEAVQANNTDMGLTEWIEYVKDNDGDETAIDTSYESEYMPILQEILGEDKVFHTDCTGGGRCFDPDMQWDELYSPELWEIIKQFESK